MGRSPKHATVCVTTGLLHTLERNELEGVLAHEIGHIKNRDVALMTMASFFASLAALVGQVALFSGLGGRDRDSGPGIAVVLLVSVAVYFLSYFLMLALSRYREFAADRSAALFTGRPSALASALRRLESAPQQDLREVASMQAFFIVPPRAAGALSKLFATHPPTEERIARLAQMESRLQAA
jgi:heat shock protein HtpX